MSDEFRRKLRPELGARFPFIPLPKAIERVRQLYDVANVHEAPVATAIKSWGFAAKSSAGLQTVAALKAFGLLEDRGSTEGRRVKLTELGARILRDPRDVSPERDGLVRDAALKPRIHREILVKFDGRPPSEELFKVHLIMDRQFTDRAAAEFIKEFNATLDFAGIGVARPPVPEPPQPSPDIEGPDVEQVDDESALPPPLEPPPVLTPLPAVPPRAGLRQDIFTLPEGEAILQWPEPLSPESYEDIESWLHLMLRKMRRSVDDD